MQRFERKEEEKPNVIYSQAQQFRTEEVRRPSPEREKEEPRPEDDPDSIEYIIAHSIGPFQMYVMAANRVK